jgi:ribosomal-protein-alanine N-acetyltransferase
MPLIRRGEAGDLAALAAIQAASPEASQWTVADYLGHDLRVAVAESGVAGFLVGRTLAPGESEILNIAVAPECRRMGIARALVAEFLREFPGVIFLEVRASNTAAVNLYNSIGFQEVNRRNDYYDHPLDTAIVMKFHSC